MRGLRCTLSFGLAVLIISAVTVQAEKSAKKKGSEVTVDAKSQKHAEKKLHDEDKKMAGVTNAAQKEAESKIKQAKDQSTKKTEEVRKEAGKGSEQGQAMREEHSKKWWNLTEDKDPATPAPAK
jgi:hypothetical protein